MLLKGRSRAPDTFLFIFLPCSYSISLSLSLSLSLFYLFFLIFTFFNPLIFPSLALVLIFFPHHSNAFFTSFPSFPCSFSLQCPFFLWVDHAPCPLFIILSYTTAPPIPVSSTSLFPHLIDSQAVLECTWGSEMRSVAPQSDIRKAGSCVYTCLLRERERERERELLDDWFALILFQVF